MVQRVSTVAFEGIEARAVDVQVQDRDRLLGGMPGCHGAFSRVQRPAWVTSRAATRAIWWMSPRMDAARNWPAAMR